MIRAIRKLLKINTDIKKASMNFRARPPDSTDNEDVDPSRIVWLIDLSLPGQRWGFARNKGVDWGWCAFGEIMFVRISLDEARRDIGAWRGFTRLPCRRWLMHLMWSCCPGVNIFVFRGSCRFVYSACQNSLAYKYNRNTRSNWLEMIEFSPAVYWNY